MRITENETTEFKREYTESIRKAVIAFANTNGGVVYVGVDDEGNVAGLSDIDADEVRISGMLRDSICPDVTMFLHYLRVQKEGKDVLEIHVQRGTGRPYYIKAVGIRPEGIFVRQGASSVPASEAHIRELLLETSGNDFEKAVSRFQNLTFEAAVRAFQENKIPFEVPQQMSLGIRDANGVFTNLGWLLSDQCDTSIKIGVFKGVEKDTFRDRLEVSGSLFKQVEDSYQFLDKWNNLQAEYGGLKRNEQRDYPEEAVREALLNAIVHRDYGRSAHTLISIFDDRMEFVNVGGLLPDYELQDLLLGVSAQRNSKLATVFDKLGWVEAYGTGLVKINRVYSGCPRSPHFEVSPHAFKVTLWNRNFASPPQTIPSQPTHGEKKIPESAKQEILAYLKNHPSIRRKDVEDLLHVSQGSAGRYLQLLCEEKILAVDGRGKNTIYRLFSAH